MAGPRQVQAVKDISDLITKLKESGDIIESDVEATIENLVILARGCSLARPVIRNLLNVHISKVVTEDITFDRYWKKSAGSHTTDSLLVE